MKKLAFAMLVLLGASILLAGCLSEKEAEDLEKEFIKDAIRQKADELNPFKGKTGASPTPAYSTVTPPALFRECRYDSDCLPTCVGNVFWKRGCDPQTDACINTFETDCSQEESVFGEFRFKKVCYATLYSGGCDEDGAAIIAKKEDLVQKANDYTAAMQRTTELRQVAAKNCISALEDVTDKLIIDTAVTFSALPRQMIDVVSDNAKTLLDTLSNHELVAGQRMSTEEYIALNCNAIKVLDTEFALLSKKRDLVIEQAKLFEGR